ncbi:hypothetical protein GCM10023149_21570 [Mucilaginibacter gynuensis]|uniref:histidine kinase n=1 Tax=Mucilaginibacter gynuensis TaxID=1302236 RepID=A0ABP8GC84_9SPHI
MSDKTQRELEKILEYSHDIICTVSRDGIFQRVSSAVYPILGYQPSELCGKNYRDFIETADVPEAENLICQIVAGGNQSGLENRYRHKLGHLVPLIWSAGWDEHDQVMHCIARDGSTKRERDQLLRSLEEANLRYSYVTRATSDALWDWDIKSNTLYWAEGYTEIFGHPVNGVKADISAWTDHIHAEDRERIAESIRAVLVSQQANWKEEYRFERANATFAYVVDRGFIIRDSTQRAVRMVGAMHDISERKARIKELKQLADDLYHRNQELQQFGYVVSHNLRSPVANIMGIVTLLEIDRDDPEMIDRCIQELKSSIHRLDEVILDLSKILSITDGATAMVLEPVDVSEILQHIKLDLHDTLALNEVTLLLPQLPIIFNSHKAYLNSILFNLIGNAVKYRSEEPPVIRVDVTREGNDLLIQVKDNGTGIDLAKYGKDIFKPYQRFTNSHEGKGLGLFLVKSHVKVLNGTIEVASEPEKGTTFTVLLSSGQR